MAIRYYTLDVNPTSTTRVKVRLYETRPVEAGGNILLLQGQLSVKQFEALEAHFLTGAGEEGELAVVTRVGRYYTLPGASDAIPVLDGGAASRRRLAPAGEAARAAGVRRGQIRLVEDSRPRAPWIRGPIITPHGALEDGEDDYDTLADRHVQRMLLRQRVRAI